jgi:hypothetical protein
LACSSSFCRVIKVFPQLHRIRSVTEGPLSGATCPRFFMQKYAVYYQKAEQPASTACLLARRYHWLARKMATNMRNATCARTETYKYSGY